LNAPQHVLAYRFSALGDVAMTVPVLACVTEQNPGLRVSMVSRPFFAPLFKEWAQVDFVPADVDNTYKGLAGLNRLYDELRRREPQAVADLHNVLRTRYLDFRFRLAGLPVEILDKGRREKRRLIRRGALASAPLRPMNERYADVFRRLDLQVDLSRYRPRRPALHQDTALFLDMFRGQKRVGVAPLARHVGKQYPLGGTKEVLQRLLTETAGTVFFLFGAPDEKKLLDTLVTDPNRVFNLAGLFDFERELEIISGYDVGHGFGQRPSGRHLRCAGFYGLGHYASLCRFCPVGTNRRMAHRPRFDAISAYPVLGVRQKNLQRLRSFLGQSSARKGGRKINFVDTVRMISPGRVRYGI